MLSLDEIRNLADAITTRSTLKLLKFWHTPSKRAGRTVTQIVFVEGGNEYRVWIGDLLGESQQPWPALPDGKRSCPKTSLICSPRYLGTARKEYFNSISCRRCGFDLVEFFDAIDYQRDHPTQREDPQNHEA